MNLDIETKNKILTNLLLCKVNHNGIVTRQYVSANRKILRYADPNKLEWDFITSEEEVDKLCNMKRFDGDYIVGILKKMFRF